MTKNKNNKITIYPQDSPVNISGEIRNRDPEAMIYPASAILTDAKEYFTKKEMNYIYERQKELFSIPLRHPRVIAIRSNILSQEDIFSMLYHAQNKPQY